MTKDRNPSELSDADLDDVQAGKSAPYKGTDIFASDGGLGTTRKTPTGKGNGGEAITLPDAQERKVMGGGTNDSGI